MEILSKENCKKIDYETIKEIGIPSIVLMENAANSIVNKIKDSREKFIIFCGVGNNGGDGLAIARKLFLNNKIVTVFIIGEEEKGTDDFKTNLCINKNLGIKVVNIMKDEVSKENIMKEVKRADCIIDSIFGIGLNRELKGIYKEAVDIINSSRIEIISIDIPSGIDGESGAVLGVAVKANKTFTIEVMKKAFFNYRSVNNLGDIEVINIDIPEFIKKRNSEKMYILSDSDYKSRIPGRDRTGHKGNYGKVAMVAGSDEYIGAAYIASESAVRTGSGLVTLITKDKCADILKNRAIEFMVKEYSTVDDINFINSYDVIGCGPGLDKSELSKEIVMKIVSEYDNKLVLDADALNILANNEGAIKNISNRAIITPHPGEMARLIKKDIGYVEENRIGVAKTYAKENNIVVLLKGYNTVITDGDEVYINNTGNSKMATGGMGDCLTGIITSLIGQNLSLLDSALIGAYLHGYIGDKVSKYQYIVNARDIIKELPKTIQELCEK